MTTADVPAQLPALARPNSSRAMLTHAVLVGLTPLIPIPLLDDVVKTFFYRSMVQSLANAHGLRLSDAEVAALAQERDKGCLYGCTFGLLEYAVKRTLRKVIFVLEWRRAIDLVTHTYYAGRLLDYAFAQGRYEPGDPERAARLRAAVETARAGANMSLVRRAVAASFKQSRDNVVGAVQLLVSSLKGLAAFLGRLRPRRRRQAGSPEVQGRVAETLERETPRIQMTLGALIERMQLGIGAVPEDHFDDLQARFEQALRGNGPQMNADERGL
jgi:hypothetical protein